MFPVRKQVECSSLIDLESLVVHFQRGDNYPLIMCVLAHEVGKDLAIPVASFPDELVLLLSLLVLSPVPPTWLWVWASIKNSSSA